MKGSLRYLALLGALCAFSLAPVSEAVATPKPCKPKTAKKCKKPVAKKPALKPAPAPAPPPPPPSTLTIGAGMPEPQANAIRSGFEIAKQYFAKLGAPSTWRADVYAEPTFDAIVATYAKVNGSDTFVRGQCPNGCAFLAQGTRVFIYPFGGAYPRPDELMRHTLIPVHELWHTVQYALAPRLFSMGSDGLFVDGPTWLREGSAEYVGYSALLDAGIDASSLRRAAVGDQRYRFNGVSLESTAAGQGNSAAYGLGFFAVELLVKDAGSMHALVDYWTRIGAGTAWPTAFQQTFGRTVEQFYAAFAQYRTTL